MSNTTRYISNTVLTDTGNSDQIYPALYGAVQKLIDITEKQSEEIALLKQNKQ